MEEVELQGGGNLMPIDEGGVICVFAAIGSSGGICSSGEVGGARSCRELQLKETHDVWQCTPHPQGDPSRVKKNGPQAEGGTYIQIPVRTRREVRNTQQSLLTGTGRTTPDPAYWVRVIHMLFL